MKTTMLLLGLLLGETASAQTFSVKISRELSFEKFSDSNALIVSNINGSVSIEGYNGDKVIVEVTKSVHAKTDARLQKGKELVQFAVLDRADTLVLYVQDGCNQFGKTEQREHREWVVSGWGYQQVYPYGCEQPFDYTMDFKLKVPASLNIVVSTINEGDVVVRNVMGVVKAGNINGGIRLKGLQREAEASTINGDVEVEYVKNPDNECRFYSLNGDINALFQPGLSANLGFESFNGSFYTNISRIESLPVEVQKTEAGDGIRYKIHGNRYQVGKGGAFLDFETFNGDVYLKENMN